MNMIHICKALKQGKVFVIQSYLISTEAVKSSSPMDVKLTSSTTPPSGKTTAEEQLHMQTPLEDNVTRR